ncbi:spike base protein, RCAP_Rcc01079 family [Phycobacter sp. K97]|uniref:spike base protein, RCAP_Rcc01079 family n=1 Tax=Phycobacter sedimenti TaxID=3133977 RepID=UPI00311E107F
MPQDDPFSNFARGLESPGAQHFAIVPADGSDLPVRPRVLYILVGGDLVIRDSEGSLLTYPVVSGQILPFSAIGVEATGTTATAVGWI